jgi:hypothetical protein
MVYLSVARRVDEEATFKAVVRLRTWPAVTAALQQPQNPQTAIFPARFSRFPDVTFGLHAPVLYRYIVIEFRVLSQMRTAAASLAINLYHADHHAWPPNLQSLVPEYLAKIPDDPFYATPYPIGYTLANPQRPLLYVDDVTGFGGKPQAPAVPVFGWNNFTGTRQWLDVTNWWQMPSATQPSK